MEIAVPGALAQKGHEFPGIRFLLGTGREQGHAGMAENMAEDVVDFGHDVGGTFGFYWQKLDKKTHLPEILSGFKTGLQDMLVVFLHET
jgi:hypothetical protein